VSVYVRLWSWIAAFLACYY